MRFSLDACCGVPSFAYGPRGLNWTMTNQPVVAVPAADWSSICSLVSPPQLHTQHRSLPFFTDNQECGRCSSTGFLWASLAGWPRLITPLRPVPGQGVCFSCGAGESCTFSAMCTYPQAVAVLAGSGCMVVFLAVCACRKVCRRDELLTVQIVHIAKCERQVL